MYKEDVTIGWKENSNLVESFSFDKSFPFPNVRDEEGDLIPPKEYKERLHDKSVVIVNVSLKL